MSITFEKPDTISSKELEEGTIFTPRFDANGLVTAIAVERGTNEVLMLAHMNAEALSLTLKTGDVHYYSRSRAKIWKKGETSSEIQKLVEMRVDCDQDALVLVVEQTGRGAACHTGRKSCFFRRVETTGTGAKLTDTGSEKLFDPSTVYSKS